MTLNDLGQLNLNINKTNLNKLLNNELWLLLHLNWWHVGNGDILQMVMWEMATRCEQKVTKWWLQRKCPSKVKRWVVIFVKNSKFVFCIKHWLKFQSTFFWNFGKFAIRFSETKYLWEISVSWYGLWVKMDL